MARRSFLSTISRRLPLLAVGAYMFLRPRLLQLGARDEELARAFPGDDLIPAPTLISTRAVDIIATVDTVWTWIAQMGRGGSGYYGLDALSNSGQPSVAYVRNDLPAPIVGSEMDGGYRVLAVEPQHMLLYGGFDVPMPLVGPMERTTLILLEPIAEDKTRLIVRTRGYTSGPLAKVVNLFNEATDIADGLTQINNIKQRAEVMTQLNPRLG